MTGLIILAIVLVIILLIIICNIKVVSQSNAFVIERLGAYSNTWRQGLHVKSRFWTG